MTQLKSRFGSYPLGFEAKRLGARIPDASIMKQRLLRSVDYKKLTAEWLLQQNPWDLAIVGFCESHPAGHYLWPAEIDTVSQADTSKIKPLLEFYVALDRAIGALAHTLPSDTSLFIVSGDGVRPNRCAWYLLPAVLERLGYISPAGRSDNAQSVSPSLIGRVKRLVSPKMRRRIAQLLPWWLRDQIGAREQASSIDWSKTRAFTLPTDLEGCIRINLKGREPAGIVEPGAEYNDLCAEIRERLLELNNPDTGAPAVRQVWIRNQVFPGDRQEQLPDLMVSWNDEAPFTSLASAKIGRVDGESADLRPGTHSPRGFLLAVGDGISAGIVSRGHLVDVAPTVMKLLRLNVPAHMDGIPLRQLVDPFNREESEQPVVSDGRH
jgi:predicted AlkP superfamily phosphohydrolase/phosphomutase